MGTWPDAQRAFPIARDTGVVGYFASRLDFGRTHRSAESGVASDRRWVDASRRCVRRVSDRRNALLGLTGMVPRARARARERKDDGRRPSGDHRSRSRGPHQAIETLLREGLGRVGEADVIEPKMPTSVEDVENLSWDELNSRRRTCTRSGLLSSAVMPRFARSSRSGDRTSERRSSACSPKSPDLRVV